MNIETLKKVSKSTSVKRKVAYKLYCYKDTDKYLFVSQKSILGFIIKNITTGVRKFKYVKENLVTILETAPKHYQILASIIAIFIILIGLPIGMYAIYSGINGLMGGRF